MNNAELLDLKIFGGSMTSIPLPSPDTHLSALARFASVWSSRRESLAVAIKSLVCM